MPKENTNAPGAPKLVEPEKTSDRKTSTDSFERVDLDGDQNNGELMDEEEIEYEEVEEEEEVEEVEEELTEEEELEEVEELEDEEPDIANGGETKTGLIANASKVENEDEIQKHAELLALPPHGSEVYIGGISQDTTEEDLRAFCESIGEVIEVRVMKGKDSGENKGFAFVIFKNVEFASEAIEKLNKVELKSWNDEDLKKAVTEAGPGVTSVQLVKVKAVYVKNLPKDITQDQLKKIFEHHGKITKVVLPPAKHGMEDNRIGFVHFFDRSSAMKALKNTEKYEIDGKVLECSLAKPQAEPKSAGGSNIQMPGLLPTYPPAVGFGFAGGAYGALGGGFGTTGFAQPMVYGGGPNPTGMAMMPMLLPDGRIGYVLQQPGVQSRTPPTPKGGSRSGNRSDSSSNRGRHSNDGGQGRRDIFARFYSLLESAVLLGNDGRRVGRIPNRGLLSETQII
ncbi:RNA-binding (RRM/RBD/RNP motif) family protein [Forsythia ovata]|uniref:RNA-binding (RRM/RBD/RNP motif) family protein n=1 Tax=Forsythia ovata TaxID=205694 RepID=A0ABD1VG97_9LAMI